MNQRKRLALLAAFMLLATACVEPAVPSTTQRSLFSTTSPPVATAAQFATTTLPVATTSGVAGEIGSEEAFLELVSLPLESTQIRRGIDAADVPLPNLRSSVPMDAFLELLRFDLWTYQNANIEGWAGVLAVEESEAWNNYLSRFRIAAGLVAEFESSEPFELLETRVATGDELASVPDDVLIDAGEGAVALVSIASLAPHRLVEPDDPDNFPLDRQGYVERAEIWIIVPTNAGWRFFWSHEL